MDSMTTSVSLRYRRRQPRWRRLAPGTSRASKQYIKKGLTLQMSVDGGECWHPKLQTHLSDTRTHAIKRRGGQNKPRSMVGNWRQ